MHFFWRIDATASRVPWHPGKKAWFLHCVFLYDQSIMVFAAFVNGSTSIPVSRHHPPCRPSSHGNLETGGQSVLFGRHTWLIYLLTEALAR